LNLRKCELFKAIDKANVRFPIPEDILYYDIAIGKDVFYRPVMDPILAYRVNNKPAKIFMVYREDMLSTSQKYATNL
jgi:hypothetical protein